MNQTTVDSKKEHLSAVVTIFNVTERTLEVPPQDKAYGISELSQTSFNIFRRNGNFCRKWRIR